MSAIARFILQPEWARLLVRITLPLPTDGSATDGCISNYSGQLRNDAFISRLIRVVESGASCVLLLKEENSSVQLVCAKACVVRAFKMLKAQQQSLGVVVGELKAHVSMKPLTQDELQEVGHVRSLAP